MILLHQSYKVFDHSLLFSLPYDTPLDVVRSLVKRTIEALGLVDVARNRIGTPIQRGISGGQKRRVTIASSVVSRPHVLLCDEPTSGLDSMSSYHVVSSSIFPSHHFNSNLPKKAHNLPVRMNSSS